MKLNVPKTLDAFVSPKPVAGGPARLLKYCVAVLIGIAVATAAVDLPLTPGTFGFMPSGLGPQNGVLIASLTSAPTQDLPASGFTARLESLVYSDTLNPLGGLTFWYQMENISNPATEGRSLNALGIAWQGAASGVFVHSFGTQVAPEIAALDQAGNSLTFSWFTDPVAVGEKSTWIVVHTSFDSYTSGFAGLVAGTSEDLPALVPSGAPPDPDGDGDGVSDNLDNCPQTANPAQADFDGDGTGDDCDEDVDGDGVPNDLDECSSSADIGQSVVIGGCDSGVPNLVLANGCTIAQRIAALVAAAQNHGQLVSGVAALKNELRKAGVITDAQAKALQHCAAKSAIP